MKIPHLFGILNLTEDSFSDGGLYIRPEEALQKANLLIAEGARTIDIGAQSSNPDATILPWEEEWRRISQILDRIHQIRTRNGFPPEISIDSYKPEILERVWEKGIDYWNDIRALGSAGIAEVIQNHRFSPPETFPRFIVMFSHNRGKLAERKSYLRKETVLEEILNFFRKEKDSWLSWGIPEANLIYDPGMGFFLGEDPELSLEVLRNLPRLQEELGKILISVSRKSFLGTILGGRPPLERRFATFATELYLVETGVDYIRTHEIAPLMDMVRMRRAINGNPYRACDT